MMNSNKHLNYHQSEFNSHIYPVLFLLFICFWSFFYNMGAIEVDSMEARNLVTAREILANENWLVPTMNGEIRIAKPPLPTWFAALVSLSAGGTDKMSLLRIPNALSTVLLILFTYGLCWTLSRDRMLAFMSAAILATNIVMIKAGHRATWDIFCHTFMLGGLWAFVAGLRENRGWPLFVIFGTFMGLSFLSKGPVSFYALFLPFILSYLWIFKPLELKTKWPLIALAFSICVFISSLWPLYILSIHSEALLATVQQESRAWVDSHVQPFWYYLKFPAYSGLWLVVTIAVLVKPFDEKRVRSVQNYRFLLLWLVLAILLLSLIPEKKYRYLLPAMIPLALLSAELLRGIMDRFRQGKQEKGDLRVIAFHAFTVSIVGVIYACILFYQLAGIKGAATPFFAILVFSVLLLMAVSCWRFCINKKVFALFYLTVIQSCFIVFLYMDFYREVNLVNPEYKRMTKIDSSLLPQETKIFFMHSPPGIKYAWDLNRQVKHWRVEEARQLLESGKTIAVISRGNPNKTLTKRIGEDIEIQIIDRFDYNENRPQRTKILLSKVRLRE